MSKARDLREANERVCQVDKNYLHADEEYRKTREIYIQIKIKEDNKDASEKERAALNAWRDAYICREKANEERIAAEKALETLSYGSDKVW